MDGFVNWDQADPGPAIGANMPSPSLEPAHPRLDDIDLALADVQGDEFSFWALQHFENNISPTLGDTEEIPMPPDRSTRTFEDHLELFGDMKCSNCQLGGYECKRIPEGQFKGYCTSCVALRCACSFGIDCADGNDCFLPPNPWPVMGDHPRMLEEEMQAEVHESSSGTDLPGLTATSSADSTSAGEGPKGKTGARFSRESVKILKNWLSTHSKHPYPNDEEKEMLQRQTGLSKTQITNWLANTRRRNKNAVSHRSTSPGVRNWANPIDIPQRRRNPFEHMNPLQRWEHSPPENEPASVTAIARAVNSASSMSSGLHSPFSVNFTDDGSGRSLCGSAISSANTSHSQSSASAYSFGSRGSFGSGSSIPRGRRRRRRRAPVTQRGPPKTYQCTFCPDTFRTKHDWQRHEKSLHLSLERWVCCPNGPRAFNPENGQMSCVFCGHANPDEAHIESHNHSACQERTIAERTFYRKDHLRQHLKLVHSAKFTSWSMEQWKATTPEIRSRCGFCGLVMDTWSIRVDHLAEHFKKGKSMADWKGGWGFDPPVMNMVENSIPPFLIHDERNSPNPFRASRPTASSARHAFELITSELANYADDWREREGCDPSDENLQRTACALVYDAEELAGSTANPRASWLRDLLFSDDRLAEEARWTKVRGIEFWQQLKINGKADIFELDPMESELQEYVKARRLLGLTAMDSELQAEACKLIQRMSADCSQSSDHITGFLIRLVKGSTRWLAGFRQRAHLPRSEDVADEGRRSKDPTTIDSTIHNPNRLEHELGEFVRAQRAAGIEPTDEDLQRQARLIIYEYDDPWNQTAADDPVWLASFKQRQGIAAIPGDGSLSNAQPPAASEASGSGPPSHEESSLQGHATLLPSGASGASNGASQKTRGTIYINDANCYLRLARELKKFVAATMSPHNPNRHVPSDEELQHQARWIIYEDDDPWNQTAADNFEWLRRFKRDVGLLTDPNLPGLPPTPAWNIAQGGSGFSPPYLFPNPAKASEITAIPLPTETVDGTDPLPPNTSGTANVGASSGTAPQNNSGVINITLCEGCKPIPAPSSTANRFVRGLADTTRHDPPAGVFCSRELERELSKFVTDAVLAAGFNGSRTAEGGSATAGFPSDEAIRERARAFLGGMQRTPADDDVLLERFKEVMRKRLGLEPEPTAGEAQQAREQGRQEDGRQAANPLEPNLGLEASSLTGPPISAETELSPGIVDAGVGNMLAQMDFGFVDMGDFDGVATGGMPMDQY
ncbi:hypothetical protein VTH06DRAFT_2024 [Thermothelomyces fergusii]